MDVQFYQAYPIEAVQINDDNIDAIAAWCAGEVVEKDGKKRIRMTARRGSMDRVTHVRPGLWVIRETNGIFRVFTNKSFDKIFTKVTKVVDEG